MQSLRVRVLSKEYTLRARREDVALTRDLAADVDGRMQAFRRDHPSQPEMTAAVMTALALAEEARQLREERRRLLTALQGDARSLSEELEEAVAEEG